MGKEGITSRFREGKNERCRFEDLVVYDIVRALEEVGWCGVGWLKIVNGVWLL
jgi:hypothetical protein